MLFHIESIYDDRWIDDIFYYTGMRLTGDQRLDFAQNKTLANSKSNGVEVYLFEVFEPQKYTFSGLVKLASAPYEEYQPDSAGQKRKVWIFPLRWDGNATPLIDNGILKKRQEIVSKKARQLTESELKKKADFVKGRVGTRQVITSNYERNVYVAEYAKRRAHGKCQLCNETAPFVDKNGKPYLETHHILWLSEGGEDSPANTVALCPNCHRKMHVLNKAEDREKLKAIVNNRHTMIK